MLLFSCKQNEIDTSIRGKISVIVTKEMVRVQHETSDPTARSEKSSQKKTVPFSKKNITIYHTSRSPLLGTCNYPIFTDQSVSSLNLTRIQIPAGTSVTNHKHGLNVMYLVFYYVDMCT